MAEPQPSNIHEGMDAEDDAPPPPAAAEDRKAAAAMSSLENRHDDDEDEAKAKQGKTLDQDALNSAINRLEIEDSASKKGKSAAETKRNEKKEKELAEKARRAKIKVDAADVTLLVEELDLTKIKATELLKANEGDAVKAMRAFVTPSA